MVVVNLYKSVIGMSKVIHLKPVVMGTNLCLFNLSTDLEDTNTLVKNIYRNQEHPVHTDPEICESFLQKFDTLMEKGFQYVSTQLINFSAYSSDLKNKNLILHI